MTMVIDSEGLLPVNITQMQQLSQPILGGWYL